MSPFDPQCSKLLLVVKVLIPTLIIAEYIAMLLSVLLKVTWVPQGFGGILKLIVFFAHEAFRRFSTHGHHSYHLRNLRHVKHVLKPKYEV